MKKINLLLFGMRGVGKSTFVNALANYLSFDSFEEAFNGPTVSVIPAKFTTYWYGEDGQLVTNVTQTGIDANESAVDFQTTTQSCRSYEFIFNEYTVQIIDTPGLGDLEGFANDEQNLANTVDYLAGLEPPHIHGICFVVQSCIQDFMIDEFEYCIKQLMCLLPKSTTANIYFMITNSYWPSRTTGGIIFTLEKIVDSINESFDEFQIALDENTIFCVENEAFKFLSEIKQGMRWVESQKARITNSWNRAVETSKRLLTLVCQKEPFYIKDVLALHQVRKGILRLQNSLFSVGSSIASHVPELKEAKQGVRTTETNNERVVGINDQHLKALQEEKSAIVETITKLASFLKANALVAYNDARLRHIKQSMLDGEKSADTSVDQNRKVTELRRLLAEYECEKSAVESLPEGATVEAISLENILDAEQQLRQLPFSGSALEGVLGVANWQPRAQTAKTSRSIRVNERVAASFFPSPP